MPMLEREQRFGIGHIASVDTMTGISFSGTTVAIILSLQNAPTRLCFLRCSLLQIVPTHAPDLPRPATGISLFSGDITSCGATARHTRCSVVHFHAVVIFLFSVIKI